MFFRQISDFDENFKFLDRLNVLLFNVWKDDNAESFKTQSMEQLEMFYRNYVNEMRQKSNEMKALEREINDLIEDLRAIGRDTQMLAVDPEIHGCFLCYAEGELPNELSGSEYFVIRPSEVNHDIESLAYNRCRNLEFIEKAHHDKPL